METDRSARVDTERGLIVDTPPTAHQLRFLASNPHAGRRMTVVNNETGNISPFNLLKRKNRGSSRTSRTDSLDRNIEKLSSQSSSQSS